MDKNPEKDIIKPTSTGRSVVIHADLTPDRQLIELALEREYSEKALITLWHRYKKRLYMYIRFKVHFPYFLTEIQEKYIIEDIVQNVFYDVIENLEKYNPVYEVSTWVYTVTNKHIMRYIRENQRSTRKLTSMDDTYDRIEYSQENASPHARFELGEFEQIVYKFVQSLKRGKDRDVFILYLQNMKTKNMGELLDHSHDAVRARLNRIIKRFKKFMQSNYPEYLNTQILSQIKNFQASNPASTVKENYSE